MAPKQKSRYQKRWENEYPWVRGVENDKNVFSCIWCKEFGLSLSNMAVGGLKSHMKCDKHMKEIKFRSSNQSHIQNVISQSSKIVDLTK